MEVINRFVSEPRQSFFLFGPRGTGKSTWVRHRFGDALRIDLLAPDVFRAYSARPERLREVALGNPRARVIVIDEVQKVPDLLGVVHSLIEEKREQRFVLTGSSSRKLKRAGVDLMAGRALIRTIHPFMAAELGKRFHFEKALKIGLLPLVWNSPDPEEVLKTYAALYVREEVQMEGLVRNVGNFSRFLESISFSHAGILNISNLSRECAVERKTVEGYVSILEDLLLGFRLPVFTKRARRAVSVHPKFFLFDAGVFRSLRPTGPLDRPAEIDGPALEGLVAQHLRAWIDYRRARNQLFFWRSRAGLEVDFVVYGSDGFLAIEVKNTNRIRPEDLRGLKSFKDEYPQSHAILLYRGSERLKQGCVLCIPCDEFLRTIHPLKKLM